MPQKTIQQLDAYIKETAVVYDHSNAKLISRKTKVKPRRKQAFLSVLHYRKTSSDDCCAKRRPSKRRISRQLRCTNKSRSHVRKPKLQIFVRTPLLDTPKTLCFRLDPGTSISNLKERIQKKIGVEARYQRLYFRRNFQLCDLLTLEDNGIEKDENISLRLSFDGLLGGGPKERAHFDQFLWDIAPKIGSTWKELAKNLGFVEADIDEIQAKNENDAKEQSMAMLFTWWSRQKKSREASQKLREALEALGLADLALKVPDPIDISYQDQGNQGSDDIATSAAAAADHKTSKQEEQEVTEMIAVEKTLPDRTRMEQDTGKPDMSQPETRPVGEFKDPSSKPPSAASLDQLVLGERQVGAQHGSVEQQLVDVTVSTSSERMIDSAELQSCSEEKHMTRTRETPELEQGDDSHIHSHKQRATILPWHRLQESVVRRTQPLTTRVGDEREPNNRHVMSSPEQERLRQETDDAAGYQSQKQQLASERNLVLCEQMKDDRVSSSGSASLASAPKRSTSSVSAVQKYGSNASKQVSVDLNVGGSYNPTFLADVSGTTINFIQNVTVTERSPRFPHLPIETDVTKEGTRNDAMTEMLWLAMTTLHQTKGKDFILEQFSAFLNSCDGELERVKSGSVTFVVRIKSQEGLDKLWSMYTTGELAKKMTEILITNELTTEDKSDLAIRATILQSDYEQACGFFDELVKDKQKDDEDPCSIAEGHHTKLGERSTATTAYSSAPAEHDADRCQDKLKALYMTTDITPTMSSADDLGHFRLSLSLNNKHVDLKVAERVFATTNRYLGRFTESRPEHYANWNLLGMLSFRLGQFEEALQYLDKVLSPNEDPDNLNALANRKYICEKLYRFNEARDCKRKIAMLLGQDDTEERKRRLRKLRARSISEQAFAFINEIYGESVTTVRYRKAFDLYQTAIELAGKDVAQSEREDWIFESGLACKSIYKKIKWNKSKQDEVKRYYEDAVNNFITIVQFSEDGHRKSSAWRHLGDLFNQPRDLLPPLPEMYRDFVDVPDKCFEEALSLTPNDPYVLNVQAKHFSKTNQRKALSLISRSIEADDSEFNLQARHIRASIYLSQYKQQLKDNQKSRDPIARRPDDTLLTRAKKDLLYAIQDVSKPWYKESMAEVLYYMALDCNGRLRPGSEGHLQQALTYCAKAVEIADGSRRPDVHRVRGMCLCAMDEHQAAIGSYKRAFECEIAETYHRGSGTALVLEYVHILPDNHFALKADLPLLGDMVYWLHKVACVCLSTYCTLWQLNSLKQMPDHWGIFLKYCEDNGYERELEVIESAAIDKRGPSGLQYLLPSSHDNDRDVLPTSEQRQHESFPLASSVSDAASSFGDASSQSHDNQRQPHAQRQISIPVSVEEGSLAPSVIKQQQSFQASTTYDETTSGEQKKQLSYEKDPEYLKKSLPKVHVDKNAAAPDTVYITFKYNLKTGKIEHSIIPLSFSESSAENAPSKQIKPGPKRPFNRQCEYDFFVICTDSASEWVEHSLLEELEGTGGLRGCLKNRDFCVGKDIHLEYSESIEKSACTIVVITKDLEVDTWCSFAMLLAVQHGGLVIPVLKEARDIPVLLRPFTYIDATGAVDWTKLERSIEQQIKPEA